MINNLSSFLNTLRQKINKGELQRKKIADAVSIHLGIEIPTTSITVKGNSASISGSSSLKQELKQKKSLILETLKKDGVNLEDIH